MNDLRNSRRNRADLRSPSNAVHSVVDLLFEKYKKYRLAIEKRAINKTDCENYKRHIEIIILDLLAAWDSDPTKFIGYSRGKPNFLGGGAYWNYETDSPLVSFRLFLNIIDFLAAEDFIENHIADAGCNDYSSRMRASKNLTAIFEEKKLNWADIQIDLTSPVIFVKNHEKQIIKPPKAAGFDFDAANKNIRRINENLQGSLINLHISDEEYNRLKARLAGRPYAEDENDQIREPLDFSNRSLRRIFSLGNYENGGRFYGGWWQGLPHEYRKHIEIEGCVTVEMDFATVQPRILYALSGHNPPEDAYAVDGWDAGLRKIIKKAFNQLINSDKKAKGQWHLFAPDLNPNPLPDDWFKLEAYQQDALKINEFQKQTGREYSDLLKDLVKLHAPINKRFFSGAWGEMQKIDSKIAELVMLRLLDHAPSITTLPIHDSFIVRRGGENALLNAMNYSFEEIVEAKCKIDRDKAVYDPPKGYEQNGIVFFGEDLHNDAINEIKEYSYYHRREAEWKLVHGSYGYE